MGGGRALPSLLTLSHKAPYTANSLTRIYLWGEILGISCYFLLVKTNIYNLLRTRNKCPNSCYTILSLSLAGGDTYSPLDIVTVCSNQFKYILFPSPAAMTVTMYLFNYCKD